MAENKGVITMTGRKKLCMAHAGDETLPKISKIAWGDGGVDEAGTPKPATGNEVGLYNKLLEKAIESHSYTSDDNTDSLWLREELGRLDDRSRTVILLKFYEDMTFREIAQVLRKPESTVKSDYYRGMNQLKERTTQI